MGWGRCDYGSFIFLGLVIGSELFVLGGFRGGIFGVMSNRAKVVPGMDSASLWKWMGERGIPVRSAVGSHMNGWLIPSGRHARSGAESFENTWLDRISGSLLVSSGNLRH